MVPKRVEGSLYSADILYLCSLYFAINTGICNIYSADGLFFGSTYSKLEIMLDKSLEYCDGILGYVPFMTLL